MFTVVKSRSRTYGYAIQAPSWVKWAAGPGHTLGWYRRKRDAQQRASVLNQWETRLEVENLPVR